MKDLEQFAVSTIEKNRIQLWKELKSIADDANGKTPVLIFSRKKSTQYACIEFSDFMKLVKNVDLDKLNGVK